MSGFFETVSVSGLSLCIAVAAVGLFQAISGPNREDPFIHRIQAAKWEMASESLTG